MAVADPRPLVSVVVPAHNAAVTIDETLSSVLAQTMPEFEAIVVDDGSTDDTAARVEAYARGDGRIRLIRQDQRGANAARNTGIAAAGAPFMAPLDADDLWHPEKLEAQVKAIEAAGPACGVAYGWTWFLDAAGRCLPRVYCAESWEGDVLVPMIVRNFVGSGSGPLIRTDDLHAVGGYDDDGRYGIDDTRLYLKLAGRCHFACVPRVLVGYRERATSRSQNSEAVWRTFLEVMGDLEAQRPDIPPRVFRRAKANLAYYFCRREMRWGHPAAGARFARRMLTHEPLYPLALPIWRELRARSGRPSAADRAAAAVAGLGFEDALPLLEGFRPVPRDTLPVRSSRRSDARPRRA